MHIWLTGPHNHILNISHKNTYTSTEKKYYILKFQGCKSTSNLSFTYQLLQCTKLWKLVLVNERKLCWSEFIFYRTKKKSDVKMKLCSCVPLLGDEAEWRRGDYDLQEVNKCGLVGVQLTDGMKWAQIQENRCPSHSLQLPKPHCTVPVPLCICIFTFFFFTCCLILPPSI